MEIGFEIAWGVVLAICCIVAWLLNLISLPGNWLAVGLVAVYAWLGPEEGRLAIGFAVAFSAFVIAAVGEVFEFAAGAMGASRAGASRKSTFYAVVGSLVGAIAGGVLGLPIPLVGSVVAALLFGSLGATAGAMYGEWTDGKSWRESWTVGHAAFWGRLLGTLGKVAAGGLIVVLVLASLII
jgi:uncharacterized protein